MSQALNKQDCLPLFSSLTKYPKPTTLSRIPIRNWKLSTGATRWLRNTFGILINFQLEKPDGFGNCLRILSEFFKAFSESHKTFLEFFKKSTAICFSLKLPLDLKVVNWYGGFHLGIEFLCGSVYLISQALKTRFFPSITKYSKPSASSRIHILESFQQCRSNQMA